MAIMRQQTYLQFAAAMGMTLTPAQRAVCGASFDGVPIPIVYAVLFNGVVDVATLRQAVLWLCGRASGKTSLGALYLLWRALIADLSGLRKGEAAFGLCIAPDMKLARLTLNMVLAWLDNSPLGALVVKRTADDVTLRRPDGRIVVIAVLAATRGGSAVRGRHIFGAVLDESAYFYDESGVVNLEGIFKALKPRLTKGAQLILSTTPHLQSGLVYELFSTQFGAPQTALVVRAPTLTMRTDDQDLIERVRAEYAADAVNADQEFGGMFRSRQANGMISTDLLERSKVEHLDTHDVPGDVSIGGDLGLINDMSCAAVCRQGPGGCVELIDLLSLQPRKGSPLSLTAVLKSFESLAASYGKREIIVDHHLLPAARDAITQAGLDLVLRAVDESNAGRELRFTGLLQAFKDGKVKIPKKFHHITDELARIIAEPKQGGGHRFSMSRVGGNHGDSASAFLLAAEPILTRLGGNSVFNALARLRAEGRSVSDGNGIFESLAARRSMAERGIWGW
jgi:hypothetical protein